MLDKIVPEDVFYKYEYLFGDSSDSKNENVDNHVDDNWGEPIDFTIEEILDMPVMGEVQTEPALTDGVISKHPIKEYPVCIGQNELCKMVSPKNSETPTQGSIPSKIDDMNVDESQGRKTDRELFCVTGKDLDYTDIDDLF